jgi:hypothetical protein
VLHCAARRKYKKYQQERLPRGFQQPCALFGFENCLAGAELSEYAFVLEDKARFSRIKVDPQGMLAQVRFVC